MTYYLKYRSQTIDELDLESVREQLKKIVSAGRIPHGLLFAGPKGTGKTSAARILAKVINCEKPGKNGEPCNKCPQCVSIQKGNNIDVIEIDAASNRGIDDIRALKGSIMLAPSLAKKKVYIVDEAHMLTLEASNAFLKTLEEPPEHVVFILATTDPEKLPATVRSRLVIINFRKANESETARQIERVAKGEKITIDPEAVKLIAKAADGSFRDSVKILEQLVVDKGEKIDKEKASEFLSSGKVFNADDFMAIVVKKDTTAILDFVGKAVSEGVSVKHMLDSLMEKVRVRILDGDMVYLLELLIEARGRLKDTFIPELPFEIALIKYCRGQVETVDSHETSPLHSQHSQTAEKVESNKSSVTTDVGEKVEVQKPLVKTTVVGGKVDDEIWKQILVLTKSKNTSVEALLRAAEPLGFDGHSLTLGVYYKFHKEKLEGAQNKRTLEDVVTQIFGNPVEVVYTLTEKKYEPPPKDEPLTSTSDKDIISAAKEIFGQ